MIVLHALWWDGALHVWGESIENGLPSVPDPTDALPEPPDAPNVRRIVGDLWDSLLAAGAETDELPLRLPHDGERFVPSIRCTDSGNTAVCNPPKLRTRRLPTIRFCAADAFDLLTTPPTLPEGEIRLGDSFSYWFKLADFVRALLAGQRFVPALHRSLSNEYHGYWRVVVDDVSEPLGSLIEAMPPVCRCVDRPGEAIEASSLVENFMWQTVDASVRRCLVGDELAHAICEADDAHSTLQMRWLQSLVGSSSVLHGAPEECAATHVTVLQWLAELEPSSATHPYCTCFRLQAPPQNLDKATAPEIWRLTLQVQSSTDPTVVIDASNLATEQSASPPILDRPFTGALTTVRQDAAKAARHFAPLQPCAAEDGPLEIDLSLEQAYHFLKEARPVLEAEGFVVRVPSWWREDRPKLRMWLHVQPPNESAGGEASVMRLDSLVSFDWRIAVGGDDLGLDEIKRLAAEKVPLVRVRNHWTEIQQAELDAALRFLEENPRGTTTALEALRTTYMADDLHTGLPVGGIQAHGWVDHLFNAANLNAQIENVTCPNNFQGTLRPYQLKGLAWLSFLTRHGLGACLCDDMGLGKTIQLIALFLHERLDGKTPGPTLLVVPMSLVGNWQRELAKFGPSLKVMIHHGMGRLTGSGFAQAAAKHDVVLCTYGLVNRDFEHMAAVQWDRVALDEAQNIKNPVTKQSAAVRGLKTIHRIAMTGTPVENRLSDLWSIMEFLNPGYLGTATEFRRRLAVPIERQRDADRAQRLRDLIRPFVLRRRKSDPNILPDLPAKWEMTVLCNMTKEQAALYQATVDEMLLQIDHAGGVQRRGLILATLVKLKQICDHPKLFLKDEGALSHRSGKCDRLTEMVEELVAEGDRALVFTQFRQMGHLLEKAIYDATGKKVLFFHGGTTRLARDKIVDTFQSESDEHPVMVLSLKAGGLGLNLNAANHVFHFDRWWNPAVEDQATDRAHRIGQHRQLQVHKFVCIGTLEERIATMIDRKRDLAENIIGGGEDWLTELDTDALRELFKLSREAVSEE